MLWTVKARLTHNSAGRVNYSSLRFIGTVSEKLIKKVLSAIVATVRCPANLVDVGGVDVTYVPAVLGWRARQLYVRCRLHGVCESPCYKGSSRACTGGMAAAYPSVAYRVASYSLSARILQPQVDHDVLGLPHTTKFSHSSFVTSELRNGDLFAG